MLTQHNIFLITETTAQYSALFYLFSFFYKAVGVLSCGLTTFQILAYNIREPLKITLTKQLFN